MSRKSGFNIDSEFYCTSCGNKGIPIARRGSHGREAGHLKRLFCLHCQREVNHVECKANTKYDKDDFQFEFDYENFDKEGNRIMPYGLFRDKMYKQGIELYT